MLSSIVPARSFARAVRFGLAGLALTLATTASAQVWPPTDLGTLGGRDSDTSLAFSVNNSVGRSTTATDETHAFLWTPGAPMQDPGTLAGGHSSEARDVNEARTIVGWSTTTGGTRHAFLWTDADGMIDLGTLAGDASSEAVAINNLGQVVGTSRSAGGQLRAFLWTAADGLIDLTPQLGAESSLTDINDFGEIVGNRPSGPFVMTDTGVVLPIARWPGSR